MRALLLPGMDGTGKLFAAFCRALPPSIQPVVASYGALTNYEQILATIAMPEPPYVIVAESFSGPLALWFARRAPVPPRAVVLAASFVSSPRAVPRGLRALLLPALFAIAPPAPVLRRWMLGEDASDDEVTRLREVLASVPAASLAGRMREVLAVDASDALRTCPAKLMYIGGRRDRLVPPRAVEQIQAVRPDVEVALLDAPHLVLQRKPVEAADLIGSFVRRCG